MGIIKNIFRDHWDQFVSDHPQMIRDSVHKEVNRMLKCGLIENGFTILLFAKLFDGSFFNLIDAEYLNLQGCRQIS